MKVRIQPALECRRKRKWETASIGGTAAYYRSFIKQTRPRDRKKWRVVEYHTTTHPI